MHVKTMRSFVKLLLGSTGLALATPPANADAPVKRPYTVAETGNSYSRLQDAVDAIGSGKGKIRFASMQFYDCAVQEAGQIAYVADQPGRAVLDGKACEGKAALVLRGRSASIEGLVFANIAVPDLNGAGIRLEKGNLNVSQSWFRDSQQGILTGNDPASEITIDKSTFTRLGNCEDPSGCAHSIYIGNYGALTVTRSRFEAGRGGHYVKSRAARATIVDNSFDDTGGRATNYMIDLPAGATGRIAGNWFVQGRDKENYSAFIAVAAEDVWHSSAGLVIEENDARFAPGISRSSAFAADFSGADLVVRGNTLGPGLKRYERR